MYQAGIFSHERVGSVGQTINEGSKRIKQISFGSISIRSISMSIIAFMIGRVSLSTGAPQTGDVSLTGIFYHLARHFLQRLLGKEFLLFYLE